jgi:hypothetical protein
MDRGFAHLGAVGSQELYIAPPDAHSLAFQMLSQSPSIDSVIPSSKSKIAVISRATEDPFLAQTPIARPHLIDRKRRHSPQQIASPPRVPLLPVQVPLLHRDFCSLCANQKPVFSNTPGDCF